MIKILDRNIYIDKIKPFINQPIIKIIVGQRRVGKSYILHQLINDFKKDKSVNIIYINKELFEFRKIIDYVDLIEFIESKENLKKKTKIFIDEIQDIIHFEKALRSLQAKEKYDIYCTGSNANLLSGELATFLSGRYIEINIFPLGYLEFLAFHKLSNTDESYVKFTKYGGHPYLIHLDLKDDVVYDYLKNIYQTILLKDVVARNKIRNVAFLEDLSLYISDNIGNLVSAKKISDFLKSQKINISNNIVLNYLTFLTNAFLIHKVRRTDVFGKKIFEIGEKYYYNDLGLRNAIVGYKINDKAKLLENVVYNHLRISGYEVKVGKLKNKEIDFVCTKNNEKLYVQVTENLSSQAVINREFGNLLLLNDNYPKMVISNDIFKGNSIKGINHINIRDFLTTTTLSYI